MGKTGSVTTGSKLELVDCVVVVEPPPSRAQNKIGRSVRDRHIVTIVVVEQAGQGGGRARCGVVQCGLFGDDRQQDYVVIFGGKAVSVGVTLPTADVALLD